MKINSLVGFILAGAAPFAVNAAPPVKITPPPPHTIVVSPYKGDPTASGTALLSALNSVTADAMNPWLIKIDAGVFDLGNQTLHMKPWVSIEGSGAPVTTITSSSSATVIPTSYADVRLLTVENKASGGTSILFQGNSMFTTGSGGDIGVDQFVSNVSVRSLASITFVGITIGNPQVAFGNLFSVRLNDVTIDASIGIDLVGNSDGGLGNFNQVTIHSSDIGVRASALVAGPGAIVFANRLFISRLPNSLSPLTALSNAGGNIFFIWNSALHGNVSLTSAGQLLGVTTWLDGTASGDGTSFPYCIGVYDSNLTGVGSTCGL